MKTEMLAELCSDYLKKLCVEISERCVGSKGNIEATDFFAKEVSSFGWDIEKQVFNAIDWEDGGATLKIEDTDFEVLVSPYSQGCKVQSQIVCASSIEELIQLEIGGKLLLLYGEIAKEQLMPKNFVFYNPKEHQQIISILEKGKPAAIISATRRNAALAGGVYPFPLIEDGDFDIPSVYTTEEEGKRILRNAGKSAELKSLSKRILSKGYNVVARKGKIENERIVITAHIDAKKGTPGAIDNATGVAVLLLLTQLMADYSGNRSIEVVAFNGEDYYAASGQMLYIRNNKDGFDDVLVNINIDGAGYKEGPSAFSFYETSEEMEKVVSDVMTSFNGIREGAKWQQGDHSIFIQYGRPAIAVSSNWFTENISDQDITHTPKDNITIVDCRKVVEIAKALNSLVRKI